MIACENNVALEVIRGYALMLEAKVLSYACFNPTGKILKLNFCEVIKREQPTSVLNDGDLR